MDLDMDDNQYSFYCSPEWHLARLKSHPYALHVYTLAYRVSRHKEEDVRNKADRFHGSAQSVAAFLNLSRWTIGRAMEALEEHGWFQVISREKFQPTTYRVVSHNEWIEKNPGCCGEKETFVWSQEDGDELGIRLWNASGGKIKYNPFQLVALRRTGLRDDQIMLEFQTFTASEERRRNASGWHGRWGSVHMRFLRYLKGDLSAEELARLNIPACSSHATRSA
jgi:hypothetical protein